MHIGVDATCCQNSRGYGRHARALLGALVELDKENRYTFFIDSDENSSELPEAVERKTIRSNTPTVLAASADGHRSPRDMWRMSRAMSERGFDVLLFPT